MTPFRDWFLFVLCLHATSWFLWSWVDPFDAIGLGAIGAGAATAFGLGYGACEVIQRRALKKLLAMRPGLKSEPKTTQQYRDAKANGTCIACLYDKPAVVSGMCAECAEMEAEILSK
jgi:hypothetical protein